MTDATNTGRLDAMLAQTFVGDLTEDGASRVDDDALIDRMTTRAAFAMVERRKRIRTRWRVMVAFAAVLVLGTTAFAAVRSLTQRTHTENVTHTPPVVERASVPTIAAPVAAPQDNVTDNVTDIESLPMASTQVVSRPSPTTQTAAELFAAANGARADGRGDDAVRLYRELQDSYPSSDQANVSRVALGRLLLDRRGDARGGLVQFDRYLANGPGTALHEEALIGRARALRGLGRADEERAAWQTLLANHPSSIYAEGARARLEQLR